MIYLIVIAALIAIIGCALCATLSKWEDFKVDQKKEMNLFKEKIFEHVREQMQESNIEHQSLKRDFETVKKQVDDMRL